MYIFEFFKLFRYNRFYNKTTIERIGLIMGTRKKTASEMARLFNGLNHASSVIKNILRENIPKIESEGAKSITMTNDYLNVILNCNSSHPLNEYKKHKMLYELSRANILLNRQSTIKGEGFFLRLSIFSQVNISFSTNQSIFDGDWTLYYNDILINDKFIRSKVLNNIDKQLLMSEKLEILNYLSDKIKNGEEIQGLDGIGLGLHDGIPKGFSYNKTKSFFNASLI